jgi:porphobilinogen synthase
MLEFERFHRLRKNPFLRDLVAETVINPEDLILPIFVDEGIEVKTPIPSMPNVFRYPERELGKHIKELEEIGIRAVILFGISHHKDAKGSDTWSEHGLLARMISQAKAASSKIVVIADTCVCEYTEHGHCGVIDCSGHIINDESIENLGSQAVIAAKAGADMVAPSSMLDGQVAAMRYKLDSAGYFELPIMSYSSKFTSHFYGPFREAGGTSLQGDRSSYMLDYRNGAEAIRESLQDEKEGADILMVKPGLMYLDILSELRRATRLPICAYNISGEYTMLKLAVQAGMVNEKSALHEIFTAFKRAGAKLIITYSAVDYLNAH